RARLHTNSSFLRRIIWKEREETVFITKPRHVEMVPPAATLKSKPFVSSDRCTCIDANRSKRAKKTDRLTLSQVKPNEGQRANAITNKMGCTRPSDPSADLSGNGGVGAREEWQQCCCCADDRVFFASGNAADGAAKPCLCAIPAGEGGRTRADADG
ncbi:MAG TPA: hypothetical protein VF393_07875, partial [archaeon]